MKNSVFFGIALIVLISLTACGSSSTSSVLQMHNYYAKESEQKTVSLPIVNYSTKAVFYDFTSRNPAPPNDTLEYLVFPFEINKWIKLNTPFFGFGIGASLERIAEIKVSLGYRQWIQGHLWGGLLGLPYGYAFSSNPVGGLIFGYGYGRVKVYWDWQNPDKGIIMPHASGRDVSEKYRESRKFYELGYRIFDRFVVSGRYEHNEDFSFEAWGFQFMYQSFQGGKKR